jgi:2-polyprenyl-3-methyl-5-hydroxy-6-metoxy-1,4-benzoquinol methylase
MKFLKTLKRKIKSFLHKESKPQSEGEYYEQLFTKDQKWSKPDPNNDENMRWDVIKTFVETGIKTIDKENDITILDLGCGRGWLSNLLSSYGNVTGIEPVKPVIEHAKKLFPNINFLVGTSKMILDTKTNNFDFVISSEVIEHIPDDEKDNFIEDIAKLLKKDGFLILTTPRKEALKEWNKYTATNQPIEEWISETELEELVTKNYFKSRELKRISMIPKANLPAIEIYQLWLFQKTS